MCIGIFPKRLCPFMPGFLTKDFCGSTKPVTSCSFMSISFGVCSFWFRAGFWATFFSCAFFMMGRVSGCGLVLIWSKGRCIHVALGLRC